MDERQTQIREAAGLDESRLNTEFVEFLRKWGPIALGVLAVAALAFVGRNYLREQSGIRTDRRVPQARAQREGNPMCCCGLRIRTPASVACLILRG